MIGNESSRFEPRPVSRSFNAGIAALLTLAVLISGPAGAEQTPIGEKLNAAINGAHRAAENVERDDYRHPKETLELFGLKPDMTVVEVLPGAGWYTEILAHFLRDEGKLIAASPPATSPSEFRRRMAARYQEKLESDPSVYGRVQLHPFEPPDYVDLGSPQSADMILTFRTTHDLVYGNAHDTITSAVLEEFFRSAYLALKPSGILGLVAHRADPDQPPGKTYRLGRLPEPYVVEMAERAGFSLETSSEINANPEDSREVPVWYLPPSLRSPEDERADYEAIGESDRMTLKFVKK